MLSGDFRQLLPIIPKANRATIVSNCLNRSKLWKNITLLKLTINTRLHLLNVHDAEQQNQFSKYLIRIGEGHEPIIKDLGEERIRLPDKFVYLIIINQI